MVDVLVHLAVAGGDASIGAVLLRILLRQLLIATELHGIDGIGGRGGSAASTAKLVGQEGFGCLGIRQRFEILLVLGCNGGRIGGVGISEYEIFLFGETTQPTFQQCVRYACFLCVVASINTITLTCKLRLPLLQLAHTDEFTINQIGNVIFQKERGGRWLVHGIGRGSRRSGSGSNSVDLVG